MVSCKDGNSESQIPVYLFDEPEEFRKYGILVCSSNNAAVENLSKELPDLENLDAEYAKDSNCLSCDYYSEYATNLLRNLKKNEVSKAWALIAVPLGKYDNLTPFLTECLAPINAREEQDTLEAIWDQYCACWDNDDNSEYVQSEYWTLGLENDYENQFFNPLHDTELNLRRSQLFVSSLRMIRCFNETHYMRCNLRALEMLFRRNLRFDGLTDHDRSLVIQTLWDSLFFLVPVVSSTFASIQTMLADIGPGGIGTLIIDEAGQAPPHAAAGALWRAQRAIVVGDPKQVEPVVTVDDAIAAYFRINLNLKDAPFLGKNSSVQVIADHMHPYGDYLEEEKPENWVGCPLRVHRRCINPMFQISNQTSYGGSMVLGGSDGIPEEDIPKYLLKASCWIDVAGQTSGGKGSHYIVEQGDVAIRLIEKWMQKWADVPIEERQGLYVISPFKSVVNDLKSNLRRSVRNNPSLLQWINSCIGTVHTFQGKEAAEVIFLLGCTQRAKGAVQWVNPNILNVAVTRAKKRVYFIGKWDVWNKNAVFKESVLFGHWGTDGTDLIRIPEHALDNYWSDVVIPEEPPHETYPLLKNLSERAFLRSYSHGQEGSFYVGCLQRGWIFEVRQDLNFREPIPEEQIRSFQCYGKELYCGLVLPFKPKAEPEEIQKEFEITIAFSTKKGPT